jgi:hypothetical protein
MKLLPLLMGMLVFSGSCKKEKVRGCTDTQAENYSIMAESDDGSCTYLRNRYIGSYSGIQICGVFEEPGFTFTIEPSPENTNRIQISGVPVSGNFSYADLKTDPNEFFIPPQLFTSGLDSANISGNGQIKGDSLFIQVFRESSAGIDTCTTKAVKVSGE